MRKRRILIIVAMATLALAGVQAQAETVNVPNGEFQIYKPGTNYAVTATFQSGNVYASGVGNNIAMKGGIANYSDGSTGALIDVPGWKRLTGTNDLMNNGVDGSVGFNAFGTWSGGTGTTVESADSLGNIEGGRIYTLSAMVSGPAGPLVLDLRAGGVALTPSSSVTPPPNTVGDWQEISRTYDAVAIGDYIGKPMTIVLGTGAQNLVGTRVVFDNVSLSYEVLFQFEASKPIPADEETDVSHDVVLSWTAGQFAVAHDVYLGTSFDDINEATAAGAVYKGRQDETTFAPDRLEFGTTYYWRIDEVNAPPDSTIFKGAVWSFTTELEAYPVAGTSIRATASSSEPDQGPENTINGSGMTGDVHSTEMTHMWLTATGAAGPAWIQYEFDKVLRLHEMRVWNHNGLMEPALGLGAKEVKIEYLIDGNDFKVLGTTHEFARAPGTAGYVSSTTIDLGGIAAKYVKITIHSYWGGVLQQYGLSEVRFFAVPVFAREPSLTSGAANVDLTSSLSWRAGREAGQHNLYLSTDQQAVTDGSAPVTTVTSPSYVPTLNLASTYYWRVDEVNEAQTPSVWPGDLWSFSTPEYLVVDDFESYTNNSPNRVFQTWIDGLGFSPDDFFPTGNSGNGSGALIGYDPLAGDIMEKTIVHSGRQSMPMTYDNGTVAYSEATRTFESPQNWTLHGIKTLAVHFRGEAGNTGKLYLKIGNTKIAYNGEAADIARAQWLPWNIDLSGVSGNLSKVTSLAIGVEGAGAKGMLYLDDIRLYPKAPEYVTPVQPDAAGLLIKYLFDQGSGTTVTDGSGKGNAGTINGTPRWVPGVSGTALDFDGAANYVSTGKSLLNSLPAFTIACWLKGDLSAANRSGLIGQNDCVEYGVVSGNTLQIWTAGGGAVNLAWPYSSTDEWHHVTVVADGTRIVFYLDGRPAASGGAATTSYGTSTFSVNVGGGGVFDATGNYFTGQIDEVYVYQRALSAAEVAGLAGRTTPMPKPL